MNKTVEKRRQFEQAMDAMRLAMAGARERFTEGLQLTRTQLEILMMLAEAPQTTRDLAGRIYLTQSAVTQTIDTLVRRGLVERHPNESDRRIISLKLSRTGRELTERVRSLKRRHIETLLETLTGEEIDVMITITGKLTELYNQAKPQQKKS